MGLRQPERFSSTFQVWHICEGRPERPFSHDLHTTGFTVPRARKMLEERQERDAAH